MKLDLADTGTPVEYLAQKGVNSLEEIETFLYWPFLFSTDTRKGVNSLEEIETW